MSFLCRFVVLYYAMASLVLANPVIETYADDETSPKITFDFPEMHIGTVAYPAGPTGVTVFHFPQGATAAVDLRGGAIGSFFTQVKMQCGYAPIDAIVFSGGSILGLAAVTGVLEGLFEQQAYDTAFANMPLVSGVSIYDFAFRHPNAIYPDRRLGKAALQHAKPGQFWLGQKGAGVSAVAGKFKGMHYAERAGQGGAYRALGPIKLALFTVLNPVGAIIDTQENRQYGLRDPKTQQPIPLSPTLAADAAEPPPGGNTTLSLLVTNVVLTPFELQQLGKQVHNSMSEWIKPFGTVYDGDIFYTVSTGTLPAQAGTVDTVSLGLVGAELAKEAIFSAFSEADHLQ